MSNHNSSPLVKELNHQYQTIDMLLTMYDKLHRRYRFRTRILDVLLLLCAAALCLTTFVGSKMLQFLQITPEYEQMLLVTSTIFVFVIAIIPLIIDWKSKDTNFGQAAEILSKLKTECQTTLKLETQGESPNLHVKTIEYSSIISILPRIPENQFNKLKAIHKRHFELSKMINLYPGSSIKLLKIFIYCRANLNLLLRKPFNNHEDEEVRIISA